MPHPFRQAGLALLALGASSTTALADWPNDRPIELIVTHSAGGPTDLMHRTMEPFMEEALGAEITVINRPGASGEIAYTALTQAKPDGYTISAVNTPSFLTMRLDRDLTYNPDDICPVARIVEDPSALAVHADSPFETLTDLIEHLRENPGSVSIGTTGVGSDEHLALIQIEQQTGFDLVPIPFSGSSESRTALLGGHVDVIGMNVGEYVGLDNAGIRVIAQLGGERSELLPDTPTAKEQGADVVVSSERGLGIRCDAPEEIRTQLAAAVEKVLNDPEFLKQAERQALPLAYLSSEQWAEQMPERLERFRAIWELIETAQ